MMSTRVRFARSTQAARRSLIVAAAVVAAAVGASGAAAQTTGQHPDFNGVWFPAGFGRRTPDPLPFTEQAQKLADQYAKDFEINDDPGRYCIWPGVPRSYWGAPFAVEIFHRPQDLTIFYEGYAMYRKIYMADANPPDPILPTAMGYSLAHWEGDTLVVETTHLKVYPYMNRFPTTSDARVTERWSIDEREVDGKPAKFLVADATVTDPKLYTEPVHIHGEVQYRPDLYILEYTCSNTLWEDYLKERGLTLPDIDALPMR